MIIRRNYLERSYTDNFYEKAFSEGYEYAQKEFGFIQDVRRSGLGRTMKRNIGRFRNKIADKIDDSIEKDLNKQVDSVLNFKNGERMVNNRIERELIKDIKNHNSRVIGVDLDGMKGNYTVPNKEMRSRFGNSPEQAADALISNPFYPNAGRIRKKISNSLKKGKDIVIHPSGSGTEYLAHELGHIKNSKSKNPIRKLTNKVANNEKNRSDLNSYAAFRLNDPEKGIGTALKRFIKGKTIVQEERNATNSALRDLKKLGATDEEINIAKKSLEVGASTYESLVPAYYKTPISNLIHTPERRAGVGYMKRKKMS